MRDEIDERRPAVSGEIDAARNFTAETALTRFLGGHDDHELVECRAVPVPSPTGRLLLVLHCSGCLATVSMLVPSSDISEVTRAMLNFHGAATYCLGEM
jgi:hypothetical protein